MLSPSRLVAVAAMAVAASAALDLPTADNYTLIADSNGNCWSVDYSQEVVALLPCNPSDPAQQFVFWVGNFVNLAAGVPVCMTIDVDSDGAPLSFAPCSTDPGQLMLPVPAGSSPQAHPSVDMIQFGNDFSCAVGDGDVVIQAHCQQADLTQEFTLTNPLVLLPYHYTEPNVPCAKLQTRKEWRDHTDDEKRAYIAAVNTLRSTKSITGRRSVYDDLVSAHRQSDLFIHSGSGYFLPWHRAFLKLYEDLLQSINADVTLPFWDWSFDGPLPAQSQTVKPVLGSDPLAFGTSNPNCVTDGWAKNWTASDDGQTDGHCLQREYHSNVQVPKQIEVAAAISNYHDFITFARYLEGLHDTVHNNLGAGGDLTASTLSPNDPLFFLHHTNIDRIWWLYQQANKDLATQFDGTAPIPDVAGGEETLDVSTYMTTFNLPIQWSMLMGQNGFCTTYQTYSKDKSPTNAGSGDNAPKKSHKHHRRGHVVKSLKASNKIQKPNNRGMAGGWEIDIDLSEYMLIPEIPWGSGQYGTVPAPDYEPASIEYIMTHHPHVCRGGKGEPDPQSVQKHIDEYRKLEAFVQMHDDALDQAIDEYLSYYPDDYEGAVWYALDNADLGKEFSYDLGSGTWDIDGTGGQEPEGDGYGGYAYEPTYGRR